MSDLNIRFEARDSFFSFALWCSNVCTCGSEVLVYRVFLVTQPKSWTLKTLL